MASSYTCYRAAKNHKEEDKNSLYRLIHFTIGCIACSKGQTAASRGNSWNCPERALLNKPFRQAAAGYRTRYQQLLRVPSCLAAFQWKAAEDSTLLGELQPCSDKTTAVAQRSARALLIIRSAQGSVRCHWPVPLCRVPLGRQVCARSLRNSPDTSSFRRWILSPSYHPPRSQIRDRILLFLLP